MRAKLFNKRAVEIKTYGTPTSINPILPSPSPEAQEMTEEQQMQGKTVPGQPQPMPGKAARWRRLAVVPPEIPGQPGNPSQNQPNNGPQRLAQPPSNNATPQDKGITPPIPPKQVPGTPMSMNPNDPKNKEQVAPPQGTRPQPGMQPNPVRASLFNKNRKAFAR